MKAKELPTQEYLKECLTYDSETGKLFWKIRPLNHFKNERACNTWNTRFANQEAFKFLRIDGYLSGRIAGEKWLAHRIIFRMIDGEDVKNVDHENGDRSDNRFSNLRSVTKSENSRNAGKKSNNKSGVTGVYWCKRNNRWAASIHHNGTKHLGYFKNLSDAAMARKAAEVELGYHPNHGRDLQTVTT